MITFFLIFVFAMGGLLAVQAMDVECDNPTARPRPRARPAFTSFLFNAMTSTR